MSEKEELLLSRVTEGKTIVLHTVPYHDSYPTTRLAICYRGEEPLVNILTLDGELCSGPPVRLLGSTSSEDSADYRPGVLRAGERAVIGRERGDTRHNGTMFLSPFGQGTIIDISVETSKR